MRRDVICMLCGFALLFAVFLWSGLFWWAIWFSGVLIWLGAVELYLYKRYGKTLSQMFGELMKEKPKKAIVVLILMVLAVLAVIVHLLATRPS